MIDIKPHLKKHKPVIGIDFDNTLVSYNDVLFNVAYEQGFIKQNTPKNKTHIRDVVRQLPDGEKKWQRLQAEIYGRRMKDAIPMPSVEHFFCCCKITRMNVFIISHKTTYSNLGISRINLRETALEWMQNRGVFKSEGWGFSRYRVYFEATREEKIERVKQLKCTHFIDDLVETFEDTSFPQNVEKILYDPQGYGSAQSGMRIVSSWKEISDYFFESKH